MSPNIPAYLLKVLSLFGSLRGVPQHGRPSTSFTIIDDPENLEPDRLSLVTPEQFDRAYDEYGQFGPRNVIAIEERWPAVIPDVDRSHYAALKSKCDEIRWTAARWAEDIRCGRIAGDHEDVLKRMISVKYPFLTEKGRWSTQSYALFVTR